MRKKKAVLLSPQKSGVCVDTTRESNNKINVCQGKKNELLQPTKGRKRTNGMLVLRRHEQTNWEERKKKRERLVLVLLSCSATHGKKKSFTKSESQ